MLESRLTQPALLPPPDVRRVAGHNFRKLGGGVLITNDAGFHESLTPREYRSYLSGRANPKSALGRRLLAGGFLKEGLDFPGMASRAVSRHMLDWKGPNVHTVVVTLRCNFKCLYCHASVLGPEAFERDMTLATAQATVDFIFSTPSPSLMIEFQGGEPLLNWPVVKFIVLYARQKNKSARRDLHFGLISNFSLLDSEKTEFLIANGVSFCTSLDGPEELHNKNRLFLGGNSHSQVVESLRQLQKRRRDGARMDSPNAICTVTRHSLPYAKEIIDQVADLGLNRVQLGPLDPIGFARKSWSSIGISEDEFVEFYGRALDRVIELSGRGVKIYEKMALIFLIRILQGEHWRFPNAAVLARLAYNYDGDIYTCEEGRLLANEGDGFFKIGSVSSSSYTELLEHPTTRASLMAEDRDSQPLCSQCAYNPYCSVLPVYNYQTQGGLWGRLPVNGWCRMMMGIFDLIFIRLEKPASRKVLESWLEYRNN